MNQNQNTDIEIRDKNNEEMEIDLIELFGFFITKIWWIIGAFLVGALLVVFVNQCLSFLSVSEAVRVIVTGLVLVLALSFSSLTSYAQRKEDSGK